MQPRLLTTPVVTFLYNLKFFFPLTMLTNKKLHPLLVESVLNTERIIYLDLQSFELEVQATTKQANNGDLRLGTDNTTIHADDSHQQSFSPTTLFTLYFPTVIFF